MCFVGATSEGNAVVDMAKAPKPAPVTQGQVDEVEVGGIMPLNYEEF